MGFCLRCECDLVSPEVKILNTIEHHRIAEQLRKDRDTICWRCHHGYWTGIEKIFTDFGMDKHSVFFMLVDWLEMKAESLEQYGDEADERAKDYYDKLKGIYEMPF